MKDDDDPPPEPPPEPSLDECCGQGCDPCIFDLYEAAQQRWRAALRAWEARHGGVTTQGGDSAGEAPDGCGSASGHPDAKGADGA